MASTSQAERDASSASASSFEDDVLTGSEEEAVRTINEADKEYTNQLSGDEDHENNDDEDDDEADFLASDDDKDADGEEEAYRRYEERTSFDHARIEIDEDYEEDLGFPMYYAGYTHRKKQLPLGMDCWKVKKIPADAAQLREMIQDQKVRRELLGKVLDEVAVEKTRLLSAIAAGV